MELKRDGDLEIIEMLYGKKSGEYILHKALLDAENKLRKTGILRLGKMCKQEYILIRFYARCIDKDTVESMVKSYWNTDKTELKKKKEKTINKSVTSVINHEVYELIVNGKYIVLNE